jgi:azurin
MQKVKLTLFTIIVSFAFGAVGNSATVTTKLKVGTKGSEIAFDKSKLAAKKGTVEITFTNQSSPDASMPHNFVLLKPGSSTDDIGAAGIQAGESKNYVPDSPAIIKATAILQAGKSEKITVELEPGDYPYLCSYPGHASMMKGVLTVK